LKNIIKNRGEYFMKLLFIGGTGRISMSITKLCASLGYDLYLLNRGNKNNELSANIKHLKGDINDEKHVADLIKNHYFDAVVNFINYTPDQVERDIRLFAEKTSQYIFISTASAYQKPLSYINITESTLLRNPYWEYSRQKIKCEEVLINEYRKSGFPITIVRPSHTYDKTAVPISISGAYGSWPVLKRMMEGKKVLIHGDGSSLWVLTHSRDFANGFAGLLNNYHAIGESFHITSDEVLTWNQIYALVGKALGVKPKIVHAPTNTIIKKRPDLIGPLWGDKANSVIFDNSKIKRFVPDFVAATRFETGVKESVEHFLKTPSLQKEDPDYHRFIDEVIQVQEEANEKLS